MRSVLVVLVVVLGFLTGCADPEVIAIRLVPTAGLEPERDFRDLDLRVYDARDQLVIEADGRDLLGDLARGGVLNAGRRYRLELAASTREGVCTRHRRAVGRAHFEHRTPPYAIPIQVGCADEIAPTRGAPIHARLLQAISPIANGAIIAGGAATLDGEFVPADPVRAVERYDMTTGRFEEVGELATLRMFAPMLTLRDGRVVIAGGQNTVVGCDETMEVLWPLDAARVPRSLAAPRCSPRALLLAGGPAFFGGAPPPPPLVPDYARFEVHDDTFTFEPRQATGGEERYLAAVAPLTLGRGALVGGGQTFGGPFELALADCGGGVPCFHDVPTEPATPEGWTDMTLTYVPCSEGGGAVYAVGGVVREPGSEEDTELDAMWCWLDRPEGGVLRPTASLPIVRSLHRTIALPDELLVVGQTQALRVPVDPCTCTAQAGTLEVNGVDYPPGAFMILHEVVQLPDETVLIHGGVSTFGVTPISAERSAWLFVRDVEWR